MAISASKGCVDTADDEDSVLESEARSAVELPRRSPADVPTPEEEDWTWEAE